MPSRVSLKHRKSKQSNKHTLKRKANRRRANDIKRQTINADDVLQEQVIAMVLLSKAGTLLRQAANRQSIHHAIRCAPSMGSQQAFRGLTDQQSVRTACAKSGEVEGKTFMDSDSGKSTGLGFTTFGAIRNLKAQELSRSSYYPCEQLAVNSIIGQGRSFSTGATGNTGGGNKPQINSTRSKPDRTAASYLSKLPVFSHITSGIEGIMADYVHQKMTKEFFSLCFSLFFLIIMKDLILFLVFP